MTFIHPSDERWDAALASAPHDVYATADFVLADATINGAEPSGFLVVDDDRVFLFPLLIRDVTGVGAVGVGFRDAISPYGYPGIVLSEAGRTTAGFVNCCMAHLVRSARDRDIVSIFGRVHPWLNADLPTLVDQVELTSIGATVSLDLDRSEADIWSGMRKGHTNAINKAGRAGFDVDIGTVDGRFDDLALAYRETLERLGVLATDGSDCVRLHRFASLAEARVAVARVNGEVAGAYLFYEHDGIVQLHLGGTRTDYMRPSPSHLLLHSIALWAKSRGNTVMHLGGGVGGSSTDSLFTFKSGFSPVRHPFRTLRLVSDAPRYEQFVDARAEVLGEPRDVLLKGDFFPAYRAERCPALAGAP